MKTCRMTTRHEDMQDDHAPSGDGHVNAACDTFESLGAQLPKLAFEMFDMRLPQLLQANVLDRFHEADEPG
ncbi:MAG: hypothetical protein BGO06_01560 [Shinella sp. 65-6]|nr:MAG: hypothetical protein BGO06_01560 [Shinella sp. 65-6]